MSNEVISIIVAVVVIILAGLLVYLKKKNSPKEEDKEAAKAFLEGLRDILYNKCIELIKDFNYKDYDNLADIEIKLINQLINECQEYIAIELENSKDILSVLALKCLTTDIIENFVIEIVNSIDVFEKIAENADISNEENINDIVEEDNNFNEEFSDTEKYNDQEMEVLPEAEEVKYSDEELAKLNPQKDEEEAYNPEDESMEIVDEEVKEVPTDDIYIDASGRARSTSTGKFVKKN